MKAKIRLRLFATYDGVMKFFTRNGSGGSALNGFSEFTINQDGRSGSSA